MNKISKKNLWIFSSSLLFAVLAVLIYLYGNTFLRLVGLANSRLDLADDYNPESVIRYLPEDLSHGCRHWYEVALRSSFDTPTGYLLETLPKVAVSASAETQLSPAGRDFSGLCEAVEAEPANPQSLNANLNRTLILFNENDTGEIALAVREMKISCLSELSSDQFGPLVYRMWRVMTGARSANPCD